MEPQEPATNKTVGTETQQPSVPTSWPGAFGLYKFSRAAVRFNLSTIVSLIAISLLVSIVFSILGGNKSPSMDIMDLVANLFGVWISAALTLTLLASIRATKTSVGEALKQGGAVYINYLILSVLTIVILGVSLVLLIVPFFIVLPRILLAPYYLIDQKLGPIAALKASWHGTRGNSGKAWGILGACFLMALLCLVLVGIYFLFMYSAALALLYAFVAPTGAEPAAPTNAPSGEIPPTDANTAQLDATDKLA
jgi:hypothetical protein